MRHRQTGLGNTRVGITNSDGHAIGVDIGSTAVRVAIVSHGTHDGRPSASVHGMAQEYLPSGVVVNGVVTDQAAVTRALKALWAYNKFECRNVIVGVTNHQVLVRDLTVPLLPEDQMAKALPYQAREVVPFPMDQALIDFTPFADQDPDSGTVTGLLIASPKAPIVAAVSAVEKAGLHVARVDLSTFAALRSIAHEDMAVEAVVDIGAHLTSIIVHTNGIPKVVRTLVRGGHELTERLVERANLSVGDAEQAKREHGLSGRNREVSDVLTEGLKGLMAEIRGSIHYFNTMNPGVTLERISLTGGTSWMPGFAEAVSDHLGIEAGVVEPLQHVRNRWSNKDIQAPEVLRSGTAVSLGLAMGAAA
ncbi:MAG: type pilus assembly protein PilM [Frankiales bacterium]|nr:type pilus assembly protein PilM [Frankiales bacterium]